MKPVLISTTLLASSIVSASTAIDGWYINPFGGVSHIASNIHTRFFGTLHSDVKYNLGYNAGVRLGYQSTPMRYEFEYTYINADARRYRIDDIEQINVGGSASANLVTANLYYDFPELWNAISPFIGVGIGYALMKTTLTTSDLFSAARFSLNSNQFAYQGIAGLTYNFSENYAINANYRYTATTSSTRFGRSFQVQMGNAGVIYRFDGCDYK
jgi:opacity protein-like surface antigen